MVARTGFGTRILAVTGALLALACATAAPAAAHAGDPTLVTRLHGVSPALPGGVTAGLRTTIADQVVLTNPTPTPLLALDPDGVEFLRVSAAGVQGNSSSPYFHRTSIPTELAPSVPSQGTPGAAPVWVPLSGEPTWSWFDPRISPAYLQVPVGGRQEVSETEELAAWTLPLRYGDTPVTLRGALERRPLTGRFETTLDPAPFGLSAVIAQGFVPTLSVLGATGHEVTVLGRDGRPYLRFGPGGAEVDRGSPTYRDDLLGRGRPVSGADTGWIALPGSSSTWLDTRLRFPGEDPPAEFADAAGPVDVARWEIPVIVDGTAQRLSGAIRWLPNGRAAGGTSWTAIGLGGAGLLLLAAGAVLVLRTRRVAAGSVGHHDRERMSRHDHQSTP